MDTTMCALVQGQKDARKAHGITTLLARIWCTSTLVRARVAVEKNEANAGTARLEQCMHKRCKDAEDAAVHAVIHDIGKRGSSKQNVPSYQQQIELRAGRSV